MGVLMILKPNVATIGWAGILPLIGAVAGAGTNLAFTRYYTDMAHVHFGLRAAARTHGEDAVLGHFHATLAALQNPVTRA